MLKRHHQQSKKTPIWGDGIFRNDVSDKWAVSTLQKLSYNSTIKKIITNEQNTRREIFLRKFTDGYEKWSV